MFNWLALCQVKWPLLWLSCSQLDCHLWLPFQVIRLDLFLIEVNTYSNENVYIYLYILLNYLLEESHITSDCQTWEWNFKRRIVSSQVCVMWFFVSPTLPPLFGGRKWAPAWCMRVWWDVNGLWVTWPKVHHFNNWFSPPTEEQKKSQQHDLTQWSSHEACTLIITFSRRPSVLISEFSRHGLKTDHGPFQM